MDKKINVFCDWAGLLPKGFVTGLATCGKIGYWGKMPGTTGSVVGILWFLLISQLLYPVWQVGYYLFLGICVYLAIVICTEAEKHFSKRDPGEIILDEVIAVPFCFIGLEHFLATSCYWMWTLLFSGFFLFRVFDILKPLGIRALQNISGGIGIVIDDVAAAFATSIVLNITLRTIFF
jgi:phosphatidylglycerophosphatase A